MRLSPWYKQFLLFTLMIAFSLASFSCATIGSQAQLKKVKLALDWFPNANHAGVFVAIEKGYFQEQGLDVTVYTPEDPASILQTVGSGADEFGISYQPDLLLARNVGVPVVSVASIVQRPLNSVMTLKKSGITRPAQLVGRKVGYPGIPTNEPLLQTMLQYDGGHTLKDVDLVNVGFNLGSALIGERVDACVGCYWTHESIAMENQGYPVNVMKMEDWGVPNYYELILVTNEDMLERDHAIVQNFVYAFRKGYMEALEDPQASIDILVSAFPEVDQEIDRPGIELIAPLWAVDGSLVGWQDRRKWIDFTLWMQKNGLVDESLDSLDAFTNEFVKTEAAD